MFNAERTKMKVFLLEDSFQRVQKFRQLFKAHSLTHSADAQEANQILAREAFDLICLDHDLTEHDNDWIASGTGYEVACFLGENQTPNDNALIIIHTMNPPGGDRMSAALSHRRVVRTSIIEVFTLEFIKFIESKGVII
jgi:CheY-like chemotaxis protein